MPEKPPRTRKGPACGGARGRQVVPAEAGTWSAFSPKQGRLSALDRVSPASGTAPELTSDSPFRTDSRPARVAGVCASICAVGRAQRTPAAADALRRRYQRLDVLVAGPGVVRAVDVVEADLRRTLRTAVTQLPRERAEHR